MKLRWSPTHALHAGQTLSPEREQHRAFLTCVCSSGNLTESALDLLLPCSCAGVHSASACPPGGEAPEDHQCLVEKAGSDAVPYIPSFCMSFFEESADTKLNDPTPRRTSFAHRLRRPRSVSAPAPRQERLPLTWRRMKI